MKTQAERATRGWVLYDGGCGVCSRWVPFWAPTLNRLGLDIAPLQAPWVADRLRLGPETLTRDLRLLLERTAANTSAPMRIGT